MPRNSNQIARRRIRRFESDMPSQAVRSLGGMSSLQKSGRSLGALPTWPYSTGWGYYPSGGLGLVVVILLILLLMGRL